MDEFKSLLSSRTNWLGIILFLKPIAHYALFYFGVVSEPPTFEQTGADIAAGTGVVAFRTAATKRIKL